ncbi:mitochondrial 2-enoyl thioester reductase [Lecanora helva]
MKAGAPPTVISSIVCCCRKTQPHNIHNTIVARRRLISTYGYTQAKSLVYSEHGSPSDVLQLHTHSISPPHTNLLTLRTLASPLNPADINQIQGTYATLPPFNTSLGTAQPTAVPGNEACFEVLSAGSGAKTVKTGDWVIAKHTGLGTWRTHLQVAEDRVQKVEDRDGLSAEQAATVSVNPVTAWRMLRDFEEFKEGEWYLQNGANSGVGRAALQLGKRWGYKCIAVVRKREREEWERLKRELEELGASKVVTDEELVKRDFKDRVMEWTNGGREEVRLALNCVGGDHAMAIARVMSPGGCMVTYGGMSKNPMKVGASMLIFKGFRLEGFWVSKWSDSHPEEKKRTVDALLEMIRKGEFRDVPMVKVKWDWDTKKEELVDAVQGTLEGYKKGKGIFVFGDT